MLSRNCDYWATVRDLFLQEPIIEAKTSFPGFSAAQNSLWRDQEWENTGNEVALKEG